MHPAQKRYTSQTVKIKEQSEINLRQAGPGRPGKIIP
jgi:hypothetical protein